MPFDETLAARIRDFFRKTSVAWHEKRMMGGLCFLVDGKMCVGVSHDRLMVRLDPGDYEQALTRVGCVPMDFTGRPLRGFVFVNPPGLATREQLAAWLQQALEFNPRAVSSKGKARKAMRSPLHV